MRAEERKKAAFFRIISKKITSFFHLALFKTEKQCYNNCVRRLLYLFIYSMRRKKESHWRK